jgi:hypothetical protein
VETPGLLDLISVNWHADAKLKGFGVCTRLWNRWNRAQSGERPKYLLFTGKGIQNIHSWSFKPSRIEKDQDSIWICLYDTPTNGTSINQLYFRHNALGTLKDVSKRDNQKLRVCDLSYEQRRIVESNTGGKTTEQPKRPAFVTVESTEGTIGVCGPYAFASASGLCNIINAVGLNLANTSSPYNRTELALPKSDGAPAADGACSTRDAEARAGRPGGSSAGTSSRSSMWPGWRSTQAPWRCCSSRTGQRCGTSTTGAATRVWCRTRRGAATTRTRGKRTWRR